MQPLSLGLKIRANREPRPARSNKLKFVSRIGVGSRGSVFRATTSDGRTVAVKVLSRDDEDTSIEIAALTRVSPHPNIVALQGRTVEYTAGSAFLVLEFCDTDLLELIVAADGGHLDEETAAPYFAQLVRAVRHCHHHGVYHLDLKPENVLLKTLQSATNDTPDMVGGGGSQLTPGSAASARHLLRGAQHGDRASDRDGDASDEEPLRVVKLADFGSAALHRRTSRASGSLFYAAPEVLPLFYRHTEQTPMAGSSTLAHEYMRMLMKEGREQWKRDKVGGTAGAETAPADQNAGNATSKTPWSNNPAMSVRSEAASVAVSLSAQSARSSSSTSTSEEDDISSTSHYEYDAAAADVWSLGVLLYVMLAGRPPFNEASMYDRAFVSLLRGDFAFPQHFSPSMQRLLRGMLRVRARDRYTIADVYRDPWVTPFKSLHRTLGTIRRRMIKTMKIDPSTLAGPAGRRLRREGEGAHEAGRNDRSSRTPRATATTQAVESTSGAAPAAASTPAAVARESSTALESSPPSGPQATEAAAAAAAADVDAAGSSPIVGVATSAGGIVASGGSSAMHTPNPSKASGSGDGSGSKASLTSVHGLLRSTSSRLHSRRSTLDATSGPLASGGVYVWMVDPPSQPSSPRHKPTSCSRFRAGSDGATTTSTVGGAGATASLGLDDSGSAAGVVTSSGSGMASPVSGGAIKSSGTTTPVAVGAAMLATAGSVHEMLASRVGRAMHRGTSMLKMVKRGSREEDMLLRAGGGGAAITRGSSRGGAGGAGEGVHGRRTRAMSEDLDLIAALTKERKREEEEEAAAAAAAAVAAASASSSTPFAHRKGRGSNGSARGLGNAMSPSTAGATRSPGGSTTTPHSSATPATQAMMTPNTMGSFGTPAAVMAAATSSARDLDSAASPPASFAFGSGANSGSGGGAASQRAWSSSVGGGDDQRIKAMRRASGARRRSDDKGSRPSGTDSGTLSAATGLAPDAAGTAPAASSSDSDATPDAIQSAGWPASRRGSGGDGEQGGVGAGQRTLYSSDGSTSVTGGTPFLSPSTSHLHTPAVPGGASPSLLPSTQQQPQPSTTTLAAASDAVAAALDAAIARGRSLTPALAAGIRATATSGSSAAAPAPGGQALRTGPSASLDQTASPVVKAPLPAPSSLPTAAAAAAVAGSSGATAASRAPSSSAVGASTAGADDDGDDDGRPVFSGPPAGLGLRINVHKAPTSVPVSLLYGHDSSDEDAIGGGRGLGGAPLGLTISAAPGSGLGILLDRARASSDAVTAASMDNNTGFASLDVAIGDDLDALDLESLPDELDEVRSRASSRSRRSSRADQDFDNMWPFNQLGEAPVVPPSVAAAPHPHHHHRQQQWQPPVSVSSVANPHPPRVPAAAPVPPSASQAQPRAKAAPVPIAVASPPRLNLAKPHLPHPVAAAKLIPESPVSQQAAAAAQAAVHRGAVHHQLLHPPPAASSSLLHSQSSSSAASSVSSGTLPPGWRRASPSTSADRDVTAAAPGAGSAGAGALPPSSSAAAQLQPDSVATFSFAFKTKMDEDARRAVEEAHAARGIGAGYQLDNIEIHSLSSKRYHRRRPHPKVAAGTAAAAAAAPGRGAAGTGPAAAPAGGAARGHVGRSSGGAAVTVVSPQGRSPVTPGQDLSKSSLLHTSSDMSSYSSWASDSSVYSSDSEREGGEDLDGGAADAADASDWRYSSDNDEGSEYDDDDNDDVSPDDRRHDSHHRMHAAGLSRAYSSAFSDRPSDGPGVVVSGRAPGRASSASAAAAGNPGGGVGITTGGIGGLGFGGMFGPISPGTGAPGGLSMDLLGSGMLGSSTGVLPVRTQNVPGAGGAGMGKLFGMALRPTGQGGILYGGSTTSGTNSDHDRQSADHASSYLGSNSGTNSDEPSPDDGFHDQNQAAGAGGGAGAGAGSVGKASSRGLDTASLHSGLMSLHSALHSPGPGSTHSHGSGAVDAHDDGYHGDGDGEGRFGWSPGHSLHEDADEDDNDGDHDGVGDDGGQERDGGFGLGGFRGLLADDGGTFMHDRYEDDGILSPALLRARAAAAGGGGGLLHTPDEDDAASGDDARSQGSGSRSGGSRSGSSSSGAFGEGRIVELPRSQLLQVAEQLGARANHSTGTGNGMGSILHDDDEEEQVTSPVS